MTSFYQIRNQDTRTTNDFFVVEGGDFTGRETEATEGKTEAEKASIFLQIRYFSSTFMIHPHSTPHMQTGCPLPHLALEEGTAQSDVT